MQGRLLLALWCLLGSGVSEGEPISALPKLPRLPKGEVVAFSMAKGGWAPAMGSAAPQPKAAADHEPAWDLGEQNGLVVASKERQTVVLPDDPVVPQGTRDASSCVAAVDDWRVRVPLNELVLGAQRSLEEAREADSAISFRELQDLSDEVNQARLRWDHSLEADVFMASKEACVRDGQISWSVFMPGVSSDTPQISADTCATEQKSLATKLKALKRTARNRLDSTMAEVGAMEDLGRSEVQAWHTQNELQHLRARGELIMLKVDQLQQQATLQTADASKAGSDRPYALVILRELQVELERLQLRTESIQKQKLMMLAQLLQHQNTVALQQRRVDQRKVLDDKLNTILGPLRAPLAVLQGVMISEPSSPMVNKIAVLEGALHQAHEKPWAEFHQMTEVEDSANRKEAAAALAKKLEANQLALEKQSAQLVHLKDTKRTLESQKSMLLFKKDSDRTANVLQNLGAQIKNAQVLEHQEGLRRTQLLLEVQKQATELAGADSVERVQGIELRLDELRMLTRTVQRFVGVAVEERRAVLQLVAVSSSQLRDQKQRLLQKASEGKDSMVLEGPGLWTTAPGVKRSLESLESLSDEYECKAGVGNVIMAALTVEGTSIDQQMHLAHTESTRAAETQLRASEGMIAAQQELQTAEDEQHTQSLVFHRLDREMQNATRKQQLLLVPALLDAKFLLDTAQQKREQAKGVQLGRSRLVFIDQLWTRLGSKCSALQAEGPRRVCCTQVLDSWRWEQPPFQKYMELEQQAAQNTTEAGLASKLWHATKDAHAQWSASGEAAAHQVVFRGCTKQAGYSAGFKKNAVQYDSIAPPMKAAGGLVAYDPADEQPQMVSLSTSASVEYDVLVQKGVMYYVWAVAQCDSTTPAGEDGFAVWDSDGVKHQWAGLRAATSGQWLKAPIALEFSQRKQFGLKLAPLGGACSITQIYVGSAETHGDVEDSPEFVQPGGSRREAMLGGSRHTDTLGETAQVRNKQVQHSVTLVGEGVTSNATQVNPEQQLQESLEKARVATQQIDELQAGMANALQQLFNRKRASVTEEQRQAAEAALVAMRAKMLEVVAHQRTQKHAVLQLEQAHKEYKASKKIGELKDQLAALMPLIRRKLPDAAQAIGNLAGVQRMNKMKVLQRDMNRKLDQVESEWRLLPQEAKDRLAAFRAATANVTQVSNSSDIEGPAGALQQVEDQIDEEANEDAQQAVAAASGQDGDAEMMAELAAQHKADRESSAGLSGAFFGGTEGPCDRLAQPDLQRSCSVLHVSMTDTCRAVFGSSFSACCLGEIKQWKWQQGLWLQLRQTKSKLERLQASLAEDPLQEDVALIEQQTAAKRTALQQEWAQSDENTIVLSVLGACRAAEPGAEIVLSRVKEFVNNTKSEPDSVQNATGSPAAVQKEPEFDASDAKADVAAVVKQFTDGLESTLLARHAVHEAEHLRKMAISGIESVKNDLSKLKDLVREDFNQTTELDAEESESMEEATSGTSVGEAYKTVFDKSAKLAYLKGLERLPGVSGRRGITEREETLAKLSSSMHKGLANYISLNRIYSLQLASIDVAEGQAQNSATRALKTVVELQHELVMPPLESTIVTEVKNAKILYGLQLTDVKVAADKRIRQAKIRRKVAKKADYRVGKDQAKLIAAVNGATATADKFSASKRLIEEAKDRVAKVIQALTTASKHAGTANDAQRSFNKEVKKLENSLLPPEPPFR